MTREFLAPPPGAKFIIPSTPGKTPPMGGWRDHEDPAGETWCERPVGAPCLLHSLLGDCAMCAKKIRHEAARLRALRRDLKFLARWAPALLS